LYRYNEEMGEVERAFVHIDFETAHYPEHADSERVSRERRRLHHDMAAAAVKLGKGAEAVSGVGGAGGLGAEAGVGAVGRGSGSGSGGKGGGGVGMGAGLDIKASFGGRHTAEAVRATLEGDDED
jgi:hypothetical protein